MRNRLFTISGRRSNCDTVKRCLLSFLCLAGIHLWTSRSYAQEANALVCGLGSKWIEEEYGIPSTWTRRGASNVFDATYPTAGVTTVDEVSVTDGKIYITRTSGSDGNLCSYEGVV